MHFRYHLGSFGALLGSILGVPGNSENWSPSCTKTIVLQIWRDPVWYLLAIFFEGYFWEAFFRVFYEFSDILGVRLGVCFETIFVFFLVRPYRVPRGCLGKAKLTILGAAWRPRAPIWESFCEVLESFGIPSNKYGYLRKVSDTLVHLAIHIQESL